MTRKTYIADEVISLSEYVDTVDDWDCYQCRQDPDTQSGYNYKFPASFEDFSRGRGTSGFISTIIRLSDNARIGSIFVSPENTLPDLAIMIFKRFRYSGYGSRAFSLGVKYCFDVLKLDVIYAGCYPHNKASLAMLQKCGFESHPEGNIKGKHYLTDEDIIQMDFVKYNK